MSKSTAYVNNEDEISKYIDTMVSHAEKHGIKIMGIIATMPMLDKSVSGITKHAKQDLEECRTLANNLQLQILAQIAKKKNDETVRKLDEFIDSILGGDDDNDD